MRLMEYRELVMRGKMGLYNCLKPLDGNKIICDSTPFEILSPQ